MEFVFSVNQRLSHTLYMLRNRKIVSKLLSVLKCKSLVQIDIFRKHPDIHSAFNYDGYGTCTNKYIFVTVDCSDLMKVGKYCEGTRNFRRGDGTEFPAYCDPEGWTVIQSRGQFGNPIDYFNRNWEEYANGFGDPGED